LDVGAQSGGAGAVNVSGAGSTLSVSGNATFGDQGTGNLSIQSGAVVTRGNATFGNIKGSLSSVTLTGKSAELDVPGTLTLGGVAQQ
jgi:autotransporter family porin